MIFRRSLICVLVLLSFMGGFGYADTSPHELQVIYPVSIDTPW